MNRFETKTNEKIARKAFFFRMFMAFLALTIVALSLIAFSVYAFLAIEVVIFVRVMFSTIKAATANSRFTFEFDGNRLRIGGTTAARTSVRNLKRGDITITQSSKEKEIDCCTVKVKGILFKFHGVENYTQLKAYIKENI